MTTSILTTFGRLFLIGTFCVLAGCSDVKQGGDAGLKRDRLLSTLTPLKDSQIASFSSSVVLRLGIPDLALTFVTNSRPLAFSTPPNTIILSDTLLLMIGTESELAFIVAHEAGHLRLEHFQKDLNDSLEIDADKYALEAILRSNYDTRGALSAIARFYDGSRERMTAMRSLLERVTPSPGISSTREFVRLQQRLKRGAGM